MDFCKKIYNFFFLRYLTSLFLVVTFIFSTLTIPKAYAAETSLLPMPKPGVLVGLSSQFIPASLKGITIHQDNAMMFDFIVQKGDEVLSEEQKKIEYKRLIKYFLASLAIPDEDQWVNLSPYEKNRIIKDDFGKTEMGRDLLTQDYILKQITASLIYPEDSLGKKFWDKVYTQAQAQYGTTNIPVNTFNKVWIIPDSVSIYETGNTMYVIKSHLKVMLEEDYLACRQAGLALSKHALVDGFPVFNKEGETSSLQKTNNIGSQVVREIVLPALEKEVNEGKNFANLRQVYSGMILAAWYKRALKDSLLGKVYANKSKLKGIDQDPKANEAIYQRYIQAYKKGVFNYIKEDVDQVTKEPIPRKYFSGGVVAGHWDDILNRVPSSVGNAAMTTDLSSGVLDSAVVAFKEDQAIIVEPPSTIVAWVGKENGSLFPPGVRIPKDGQYVVGDTTVFIMMVNNSYSFMYGSGIYAHQWQDLRTAFSSDGRFMRGPENEWIANPFMDTSDLVEYRIPGISEVASVDKRKQKINRANQIIQELYAAYKPIEKAGGIAHLFANSFTVLNMITMISLNEKAIERGGHQKPILPSNAFRQSMLSIREFIDTFYNYDQRNGPKGAVTWAKGFLKSLPNRPNPDPSRPNEGLLNQWDAANYILSYEPMNQSSFAGIDPDVLDRLKTALIIEEIPSTGQLHLIVNLDDKKGEIQSIAGEYFDQIWSVFKESELYSKNLANLIKKLKDVFDSHRDELVRIAEELKKDDAMASISAAGKHSLQFPVTWLSGTNVVKIDPTNIVGSLDEIIRVFPTSTYQRSLPTDFNFFEAMLNNPASPFREGVNPNSYEIMAQGVVTVIKNSHMEIKSFSNEVSDVNTMIKELNDVDVTFEDLLNRYMAVRVRNERPAITREQAVKNLSFILVLCDYLAPGSVAIPQFQQTVQMLLKNLQEAPGNFRVESRVEIGQMFNQILQEYIHKQGEDKLEAFTRSVLDEEVSVWTPFVSMAILDLAKTLQALNLDKSILRDVSLGFELELQKLNSAAKRIVGTPTASSLQPNGDFTISTVRPTSLNTFWGSVSRRWAAFIKWAKERRGITIVSAALTTGIAAEQLKAQDYYPASTQAVIQSSPNASSTAIDFTKGGIDFNASHLNFQIKRDGQGVPLPINEQNLENINIEGLIPIIIQIQPAISSSLLSQLPVSQEKFSPKV